MALKIPVTEELTAEEKVRYEGYGRIVDAIAGYHAYFCEDSRCSELEGSGLDALDALADIMTEHSRLRANADPFLTCDPDD